MLDSVERYEKLVAKYPANELARFSLGRAWFTRGDYARAQEQLLLALARKPDWIVALLLLGRCEAALGRPDDARIAFERARQLVVGSGHEGPIAEIERALADLKA